MRFSIWLEGEEMTLLIKDLVMTKSELFAAIENIARGYPAVTEGPVEVAYMPKEDKYHLVNGYHRMVAAMVRNAAEIRVKVQDEEATWGMPPADDLFVFDSRAEYGGLEDFIEPHLLRNL